VNLNRDASFQFTNYDDEIIANKKQLSDYLYSKVTTLFNRNNKIEIIPNRSTDKNDKNSVLSYSVDLLDIDCQKGP